MHFAKFTSWLYKMFSNTFMDNIETISFSFTVNAVVAALLFYVFLPAVSAIITMEKFLSFLEIATTISQTVTQKKKENIWAKQN